MTDAAALTAAFSGVDGVFVIIPPIFDPTPGFPEARAIITAVTTAIGVAKPPKVVCLSTIGAQATQPNLLTQLGLLERALGALPTPVCFLRAAWFMENAAWDVAPARDTGVVPSFLQPLDKPVPMVATADIGHVAPRCCKRPGRAAGSSNSKDRDASLRTKSPRHSPKSLAGRSAWKPFPVTPGRDFSRRRA